MLTEYPNHFSPHFVAYRKECATALHSTNRLNVYNQWFSIEDNIYGIRMDFGGVNGLWEGSKKFFKRLLHEIVNTINNFFFLQSR